MARAPLSTRYDRSPKGRDELASFKRRVAGAARLALDVVHLRAVGPALVRARRVRSAAHAKDLVRCVKRDGLLDRASLEDNVELVAPPIPLDAALLAAAHRDLRVIEEHLDVARRNRRSLARYGSIDGAWVAARTERLHALRDARAPARWREAIVELVRALRDERDAKELERAFGDLDARPAERRAELERRVLAIGTGDRGDDAGEQLAVLALVFPIGADGVPALDGVEIADALHYAGTDLTLAAACALSRHRLGFHERQRIGRLVSGGLELDLVAEMAKRDLVEELTELDDVRAARAFATWTIRLGEYARERGVTIALKPQLFESTPRNEDLAVLTMCLLDHAPGEGSDPLATLDATLGLFQRDAGGARRSIRLRARARGILGRLRGFEPGAGRRADPTFAAWLDDDVTLDRLLHVAQLAGEPALTHAVREDFEHGDRRERERRHLEGLPARTPAQTRRFAALLAEERTVTGTPRAKTRRRVRARLERLLPIAYRRELDGVFRQILAEGWGITAPTLTPAWRDAVRFWLVVDDNKETLEALLREAANAPGRSVVRAFAPSRRWIARNEGKIDVDAWLAPRRTEVIAGGSRLVVALEEDPLEILRMGIPFGTCLALADGENAASTVLNAAEANKRVIYARNQSGNVVARKLIGITASRTLVGYHLYSSASAEAERPIRRAIDAMCSALGHAVGVPLAATGTPEKLHEDGFWYDDGEVPFEPPGAAFPDYCASLRLTAAPAPDDETLVTAQRWRARESGDLTAAIALLEGETETPEGAVHEDWVMDKLGLRRAVARARSDGNVSYSLFRALAKDERGMLLALEAASRLSERKSDDRLYPLLLRFPPSPRLGVALVGLALRSMRYRWASERGHAYLTLTELPRHFEDVAGALDLLDAIEPAWTWIAARLPANRDAIERRIADAVEAVEDTYTRRPDAPAVVAALMSRRRSRLAHRAALHVAAAHALPEGRRALQRFAVLEPDLFRSGDGLAAFVRQGRVARVTPAFAMKAPRPQESPYESLRELVALPGIELVLDRWATPSDGAANGPWEEAWRRRRGGATPEVGRDAVDLERARRALFAEETRPAERDAARAMLLASREGGPGYWVRLLDACLQRGDVAAARQILETRLEQSGLVSARLIVDLWTFQDGALRDLLVAELARERHPHWSARVCAAELEARARGERLEQLRERVALALVLADRPAIAIGSLTTIDEVRSVLAYIVERADPAHVAAAYAHLADPLSVRALRELLAKEERPRREAIVDAIDRLERTSLRAKTFFALLATHDSCDTGSRPPPSGDIDRA